MSRIMEDRLSTKVVFSSLVALIVPAIALAGGPASGTCSLSKLDGVRLLLARSTVADLASGDPAEFDRHWREFARAATAVLGAEVAADSDVATRGEYVAALNGKQTVTVACDAGSVSRDRAAYTLGLLGYSLDEITRMVTGRVSRSGVDTDAARKLACLPPRPSTPSTADVAAGAVLVAVGPTSLGSGLWSIGESTALPVRGADPAMLRPVPALAMFRPASALVSARSVLSAPGFPVPIRPVWPATGADPVLRTLAPNSAVIDWWTRYYSLAYGVDYRLVAAIIRQESNWQPAAVSNKGAIGLMQLMPTTAAMLRVNPRDPIDNLRGGIAYLAGLLGEYGNVRSALIAYNAGPAHADQVLRGEREPFPETQRYLIAVDAAYPIGSRRK